MKAGVPINVLVGDGASQLPSRHSRNNGLLRLLSGATCGSDVVGSVDGDNDLLTADGDKLSSNRGWRCVARYIVPSCRV